MSNPQYAVNGNGQRVDSLIDLSGAPHYKLAVGTVSVGGTTTAAWAGVATHTDGATAGGSDGVVVLAGQSGTTVKHVLVDSAGRPIIVGGAADGAALAGSPVLVGAAAGATAATLRTPATFKSATATGAGNTAVWTPTGTKKFRLMRFAIGLTDDVARATGGVVTVKFQDATTDIGLSFSVYVPVATIAAPIGAAFFSGWIDLGNGYLSALADNVLNINLSVTLTAGNAYVITAGTEE